MRRAEDAASEATLSLPLALVLFAVVLATYVKTAYPTVPGGDAGELVFTSCSLGVAHPPGMQRLRPVRLWDLAREAPLGLGVIEHARWSTVSLSSVSWARVALQEG